MNADPIRTKNFRRCFDDIWMKGCGGYASKTISKVFSDPMNLLTWGLTIDEALKVHFDHVGRCVHGYDAWIYETKRYYGENGLKVQKSRKITLKLHDEAYMTNDQLEEPYKGEIGWTAYQRILLSCSASFDKPTTLSRDCRLSVSVSTERRHLVA